MIDKILSEISRLKNELDGYSAREALDYIESYINTFSKSKLKNPHNSEKPNSHSLVEFEPAKGFDSGSVSVYHEGLDEAAEKYANYHPACFHKPMAESFKAGAEWQKEQMMKDGLDAVKSCQFDKIEKTIAGVFVKYGMDMQKQDMMKEAVEGKVFMSFVPGHNQMVMADVDLPTNTKVKLIIVKEDEE